MAKSKCFILVGKVQGVSCRAHIQRKALELGVNGWVRNLVDGRVQVVIQASEELLLEMEEYFLSNPGRSRVDSLIPFALSEDETYNGFSILGDGAIE